jgi:anti-sigma regulatory factor (Ser/Thr protein kinase)
MEKKQNNELPDEITQPARIDSIPVLVEFASAHARETGFHDKIVSDIGDAVEEALHNITRFACCEGIGDITISCSIHDNSALFINIIDTGTPFNMLLASTFPEAEDFLEPGQKPSTKLMKRAIKNIEYKRDANRNILIFIVWRDPNKMR